MHFALENQCAILEIADDDHDRTAVRDPGLLPLPAHRIVAQDAVSDKAVALLILFMDRAALRDRDDMSASLRDADRGIRVERVPVPDPEIQTVVLLRAGAVRM